MSFLLNVVIVFCCLQFSLAFLIDMGLPPIRYSRSFVVSTQRDMNACNADNSRHVINGRDSEDNDKNIKCWQFAAAKPKTCIDLTFIKTGNEGGGVYNSKGMKGLWFLEWDEAYIFSENGCTGRHIKIENPSKCHNADGSFRCPQFKSLAGPGFDLDPELIDISASHPVETCTPEEKMYLLTHQDNTQNIGEIVSVIPYEFSTIGIIFSSRHVPTNVGIRLLQRFATEFGFSQSTRFNWSSASQLSIIRKKSRNLTVHIPSGFTTIIHQLVGECGPYIIMMEHFKRTDSDRFGTKYLPENFNTTIVNGTLVSFPPFKLPPIKLPSVDIPSVI